MGFKGTPGPWAEHRNGFSTVYIEARLRQGVIQEVAACGPTEAGSEAQSANARLIAAAPDLLEALIKIVEMNQQYAIDKYGDVKKAEEMACVRTARQAISKALGG